MSSLGLCFFICAVKSPNLFPSCFKMLCSHFPISETTYKKTDGGAKTRGSTMVKETESAQTSRCRLDPKGCGGNVCLLHCQNQWSQPFAQKHTRIPTPKYTPHTLTYTQTHACAHTYTQTHTTHIHTTHACTQKYPLIPTHMQTHAHTAERIYHKIGYCL